MNLMRLSISMFLCAALVLLIADPALAIGDGTVGNFSCSNGQASGQLYVSNASCPTTLGIDNFFSFLICNMEQLSSNLMGHMFCGMISSLAPLVWVAATLSVIFFAIAFMFGIVPLHGREAIMFIIKIAFFTGFATNADLLIGTGYRFLINGIHDGVTIALDGMGGTINSGDDLYKLLDETIAKVFHFATDGVNATETNKALMCKNAIFAVLATMMVAFPMLSYLGLVLLGRIAITFFRAVFGYIYALVGVTFLITLAPIFLTFALFKNQVIHAFFDKWIGYLVSFSLQMVLVFSFLGFVMMIDVKNLTDSINDIVMYKTETVETSSMRFPWTYCTLCEFKVVDKTSGSDMDPDSPDFIEKGKLQCKDSPPKAITLTFGAAPDSNNTMSSLIKLAGTGIFSLIVLAILVERLLAMIPYLGQKLASGLGGTYVPQLGGGQGAQGASVSMPGDRLVNDFSAGFHQSYKRPDTASRDGLHGAIDWLKDGASSAVTGRMTEQAKSNDGKLLFDKDNKPIYVQTKDAHGNPIGDGFASNVKDWMSLMGRLKK